MTPAETHTCGTVTAASPCDADEAHQAVGANGACWRIHINWKKFQTLRTALREYRASSESLHLDLLDARWIKPVHPVRRAAGVESCEGGKGLPTDWCATASTEIAYRLAGVVFGNPSPRIAAASSVAAARENKAHVAILTEFRETWPARCTPSRKTRLEFCREHSVKHGCAVPTSMLLKMTVQRRAAAT